MNTTYSSEQIVYQVGINITTNECVVEPQKILYVGKTALFVDGNSAEWGQTLGEQTLSYFSKDRFEKEEVIKKSTCCFWTDTIEKAEQYKSQIVRILEAKKQLLTA